MKKQGLFGYNGHMQVDKPLDFPGQAILCAVQLPEVSDVEFRESLEELGQLARTLGVRVIGEIVQRRSSFDAAAYLGPGKMADLTAMVQAQSEGVVVLVDHEISPSQARHLEERSEAELVLDRTALILEIFHRHAHSRQAKLQVEMVRLAYMAPRLRETDNPEDTRQRGFIGGKGAGETALDYEKRKVRDRLSELKRELLAIARERKVQRARRREMQRVAICGYTNAGKSTLFHALTESEVYIADELFATLETTVRILHPETKPKVLVSDTVGFIRHLPTKLINSFKSTLEEAAEADLVIHVVDASDPAWERQLLTTRQVLGEIGAGTIPHLLVMNKIDRMQSSEGIDRLEALRRQFPAALFISAYNTSDVEQVYKAIVGFFDKQLVSARVWVSFAEQEQRAEIHDHCQVVQETWDEEGGWLSVRATREWVDRLKKRPALRVEEEAS